MPYHDQAGQLAHVPGLELRLGRDLLRVRHLDAAARAVEAPGVKRTADRIAFDLAAVPEMRAEVRAKSVEHARFSALGSIRDEVLVEVTERDDFAGQELVGVGHLEP